MMDKVLYTYKECVDKSLPKEQRLDYYRIIDNGVEKWSRDWSMISWSNLKIIETTDYRSITFYKKYQEMVRLLAESINMMPLEYDYYMYYENIKD